MSLFEEITVVQYGGRSHSTSGRLGGGDVQRQPLSPVPAGGDGYVCPYASRGGPGHSRPYSSRRGPRSASALPKSGG